MSVASVAMAIGISRYCAHRWVACFEAEGVDDLEDHSSRSHRSPRRTDETTVARVLQARHVRRDGPGPLSVILGIPARTNSRIFAREGVARLSDCDPMTGERIWSLRATAIRDE